MSTVENPPLPVETDAVTAGLASLYRTEPYCLPLHNTEFNTVVSGGKQYMMYALKKAFSAARLYPSQCA